MEVGVSYSSLTMLALAVGFVELTRGTLRALFTFFSVHFATLLVLACIILCFHALGPTLPSHLITYPRCWASAGYFGCLGLAITSCKPAWRAPIISTISLMSSFEPLARLHFCRNRSKFSRRSRTLIALSNGYRQQSTQSQSGSN